MSKNVVANLVASAVINVGVTATHLFPRAHTGVGLAVTALSMIGVAYCFFGQWKTDFRWRRLAVLIVAAATGIVVASISPGALPIWLSVAIFAAGALVGCLSLAFFATFMALTFGDGPPNDPPRGSPMNEFPGMW